MARSRTLSASVPDSVYRRTKELVREEDRKQSEIVTEALRLYTSLSPLTRRIMEETVARYGPSAVERLEVEVQRAALRARWEALAEETADEIRPELLEMSAQKTLRTVGKEIAESRSERRGGEVDR